MLGTTHPFLSPAFYLQPLRIDLRSYFQYVLLNQTTNCESILSAPFILQGCISKEVLTIISFDRKILGCTSD